MSRFAFRVRAQGRSFTVTSDHADLTEAHASLCELMNEEHPGPFRGWSLLGVTKDGKPVEFCTSCEDDGKIVAATDRGLCDDCYDCDAERAQERSDSEYYGGSGPVTLAEEMAAARTVR